MSYSDNRLYLYDNLIELVLSSGTLYLDNRPMNNRKLVAHKGVDNEIFFTIRDRDRKLQNVFSETLRAFIIDPSTRRRVLQRLLEHTSEVGKVKLVLTEADLASLTTGLHYIYITHGNTETHDHPVYTDQNNNLKFDIEITNQVGAEPVPTQTVDQFLQTGNTVLGDSANTFVSSALYGNLNRNFTNAQHTLGIYPESYTGQVLIQASCLTSVPDSDDASKDWFVVDTLDLDDTSNITMTTFQVNCNWVRILSKPESGSINKVVLRN